MNNYEPEPIPALLVSSSEKDWLTVSPYAIKFWDKLNLEPYSKSKNIAYVVLVPDFSADLNDFNLINNPNMMSKTSESHQESDDMSDLNQIHDYFKEFNSVYELCRLGVHRPAFAGIQPSQNGRSAPPGSLPYSIRSASCAELKS